MLEGKRPPARRVLVYDCEGYFLGAGLAELLESEGHDVVLATPFDNVAPVCDETLEGPRLRRHLHDRGVHVLTETVLTALEPGRAVGTGAFDAPLELAMDAIVLVTQRLPRDGLYRELVATPAAARLAAGVEAVYRVGDCVAPRMLGDAIFDGHRLAREIDGPHPSVPLPYLRERLVAASPYQKRC
jgi:dimethylamine/trimethylamine dehydrogenase